MPWIGDRHALERVTGMAWNTQVRPCRGESEVGRSLSVVSIVAAQLGQLEKLSAWSAQVCGSANGASAAGLLHSCGAGFRVAAGAA
jgi:hypothetical protein